METRANFILIGAFTILSLILAVIFTVWIANVGFDKKYHQYDVVFEGPVRGLEIGGDVKFNGIKVGEVIDLNLDKKNAANVVARIRVFDTTPVKTDSVAQLEPAGLTGLNYIQILAGSANAGPLERLKGEDKPRLASRRGQLDRIVQGGEGVITTTLETMSRVNRLLSEDNIIAFNSTLRNFEHASALIGQKGQMLDRANQAAATINQAGRDVSMLSQAATQTATTYNQLGINLIDQTKDLSSRTNTFLDAGTTLATDMTRTSRNANETIAKMGDATNSIKTAADNISSATISVGDAASTVDIFFAQGTYETLPQMSQAAQNFAEAGENINRLVSDANTSPVSLLSRSPPAKVKWKR